jgi:dipeptidyl aminopeptidase/acylaminoacyl peptidase
MTLLDLAQLSRILNPQLSPDGRTLVYHRSRIDWKAGVNVYHVWRQDIGAAPAQLTFAEPGENAFPGSLRWSPDGKTLSFVRAGQIYLMPADGGEPRALTRHVTNVNFIPPAWTPDGAAIYFVAPDQKPADDRERDRLRDDAFAFDENFQQRHLWKVVVSTGAETQITSGEASVLGFRLSADGKSIALHRAPSPMQADAYRGEVWTMDANGEHARVATHNSVEETGAELSPDAKQVLFLADANERFDPYYNTNLFIVPAAGGTPRLVVPDFDKYAFEQATWAPDGRSIFAVVNMGVHNELFQIDVSSRKVRQLTDGKHFITAVAGGWSIVSSAKKMVLQLDEPTRFGEVWTMAVDGDRNSLTRVTDAFATLERDFILPRQEKVEWASQDGTAIEGLLFYPMDYAPGKRYPLVVQMHGGPMESDKYGAGPGVLQNYFPVLTAMGYAVLRPNYRGSAGYGNAVYRDVVGHYFQNMQRDVMSGVDALIQRGIADPDRLVVMGWSAGGHLTNKLITMTDRFKAASSGAGVADWISMYAQTDTRANRTLWFGGTPWQKDAPFATFWDHSPLKDVAHATTPTLFFVGENDPRVPMPQSVEMYRALKSNGVATQLLVAPREGHQWAELRHLLFKANTELEWFEKYARGRSYTWEKAPL